MRHSVLLGSCNRLDFRQEAVYAPAWDGNGGWGVNGSERTIGGKNWRPTPSRYFPAFVSR